MSPRWKKKGRAREIRGKRKHAWGWMYQRVGKGDRVRSGKAVEMENRSKKRDAGREKERKRKGGRENEKGTDRFPFSFFPFLRWQKDREIRSLVPFPIW